jgi:predicted short-subunit dehydrogenase-like oxidoreductase (DUF2520 family)
MAKSQPIALVAGGQVSRSFLVRLPHLRERIGPVKAASNRVASRIVNAIHAGYPVNDFESITKARNIAIYVPAGHLALTLRQLRASCSNWHGKVVILCDAALSSTALELLASEGAAVASLAPIEGFDERRFVLEGDPPAVRAARKLVEDNRTRALEIAPGTKDLFLAGLVFATSLFTPMAAAATECLKGAGLKTGVAAAVSERLFERSLRGYIKAGRKGWGGPLASRDQEQVNRHLDALFRASPLLASYYTESALFALRLFRQEAGWLPLARAGLTA